MCEGFNGTSLTQPMFASCFVLEHSLASSTCQSSNSTSVVSQCCNFVRYLFRASSDIFLIIKSCNSLKISNVVCLFHGPFTFHPTWVAHILDVPLLVTCLENTTCDFSRFAVSLRNRPPHTYGSLCCDHNSGQHPWSPCAMQDPLFFLPCCMFLAPRTTCVKPFFVEDFLPKVPLV